VYSLSSPKRFKVKVLCPGDFSAPALITRERISLLGGVDPERGILCDPRSELVGNSFADRALIFTSGKGSSLWSSILGKTKRAGTAPAAIINLEIDTFVVFACVVCDIPMLQLKDGDIFDRVGNGEQVRFDAKSSELVVG